MAQPVASALEYFDGERYCLHSYVVMPNHVHALLTPRGEHTLSAILHSWKSFTANECNKILGRVGKEFWQRESYDHLVRDAEDFARVWEYIRNNPVKAGLVNYPEEWRFFWCAGDRNDAYASQRNAGFQPVERSRQDACATVQFKIFEPRIDKEVPAGTVTRAKGTCLFCGNVLPPERVRAQLASQRGGADVVFDAKGRRMGGAHLLAVVTLRPGESGRQYRLSTERDYEAVWKAQRRLKAVLGEWERAVAQASSLLKEAGKMPALQATLQAALPPCPVPDEALPPIGTLGFRVQRYGMLQWGDLFTARQKVALVSFAKHVLRTNGGNGACNDLMAIAVGRIAVATASLTSWLASGEEVKHVFARQALPIVWDFGETNPTSEVSRSWSSALDAIYKVVNTLASARTAVGQAQQADSCQSPLPDSATGVWFTDPPYYDAIPWQARCLGYGEYR